MLNNKEQYNHFFGKSTEHAYGKPGKLVESIAEQMKSGHVLDLGSGDGRNSAFLAQKGFLVTAIDTSTVGIQKLAELAKQKGWPIEAHVADVTTWSFNKEYDAILAIVLLQHLKKNDAVQLLSKMKTHTQPNGLNAVSLFTDQGDRFLLDQTEDPEAFYPKSMWLKEFYHDWEILSYEEAEAPLMNRNRADGKPMTNMVSKILARKPISQV